MAKGSVLAALPAKAAASFLLAGTPPACLAVIRGVCGNLLDPFPAQNPVRFANA